MNDDKIALVVHNPEDAKMLINNIPEIENALVITTDLPPGTVVVISKDEFIRYLREKKLKDNRKTPDTDF